MFAQAVDFVPQKSILVLIVIAMFAVSELLNGFLLVLDDAVELFKGQVVLLKFFGTLLQEQTINLDHLFHFLQASCQLVLLLDQSFSGHGEA